MESKKLEKNAEHLSKVTEQWMQAIESFSYALKVGLFIYDYIYRLLY